MTTGEPSYRQLIHAYLKTAKFGNRTDEVAEFWRRRRDAIGARLGVDLTAVRQQRRLLGEAQARQMGGVDLFVEGLVRAHGDVRTVFGGMMEGPPAAHRVWTQYGQELDELTTRQREIYVEILDAIVTELWGLCETLVSEAELALEGLSLGDEPDLSELW